MKEKELKTKLTCLEKNLKEKISQFDNSWKKSDNLKRLQTKYKRAINVFKNSQKPSKNLKEDLKIESLSSCVTSIQEIIDLIRKPYNGEPNIYASYNLSDFVIKDYYDGYDYCYDDPCKYTGLFLVSGCDNPYYESELESYEKILAEKEEAEKNIKNCEKELKELEKWLWNWEEFNSEISNIRKQISEIEVLLKHKNLWV